VHFSCSANSNEGAVLKALLAILLTLTAAMTGLAQAADCYLPWNARPDLRTMWLQADCNYRFPPRDGFVRAPTTVRLRPGSTNRAAISNTRPTGPFRCCSTRAI
jgi:hypothetical protein